MDFRFFIWSLCMFSMLMLSSNADAQGITLGDPATTQNTNDIAQAPSDAAADVPADPNVKNMVIKPGASPAAIILQLVQSLSYFAIPFGLLTLVAIWFTTERIVVLRRGRVIPKPFVQRFMKLIEDGELNRDEALQICEENGSPVALVFAHGVRKWGKSSVEVEQAMIDGGERQVSALQKHLRVINGIATISPLMGLLGTVWGVLESFNKIAEAGAMGQTEQLASGIALALVTTAAGLIIAIPCLVSYMYLCGRVDALVAEMDDLAMRVVHNICAEGISERMAKPRRTKEPAEAAAKKA
ncbi:MotA/TolQ/ExbB proton channel family protein [Planctomicrobium sp. SH668]|uniref:MotA/TolQ/ExbB proton channel family protein n=1 Tax=Planctomicrobium sp. SH668 TaxID=3448126 RepID=UPI003F5AE865